MKKIKAVVIDDEASNRGLVIKLISELNPNFEILGEADGVKSGIELINRVQPEIIFLDIKMPDGSGFSLLEYFDELSFGVVFITGFDSYALKAFEFNALDYIIKPIDPEKFVRTLGKIQGIIEKRGLRTEDLKSILQTYDSKQLIITRIPIHAKNRVVFLNTEEIIYVMAEDGCTVFKTTANEKHYSSKQLSDFEFILEGLPQLARVNRSSFVNLNYVKGYTKGAPCFLLLKDDSTIEISRRKKSEILALLVSSKKID